MSGPCCRCATTCTEDGTCPPCNLWECAEAVLKHADRDAPGHSMETLLNAEEDLRAACDLYRVQEATKGINAAALPDLLAAAERALSIGEIDADDGALALSALCKIRPILRAAIAKAKP